MRIVVVWLAREICLSCFVARRYTVYVYCGGVVAEDFFA